MKDFKFLIVVAYYNRPEIVKNALLSILDISYPNFDIAFIDDGSDVLGEDIVKDIFTKELMSRTKIYRINDTVEDKIKQGGSRFGFYINQAIIESDSDYFILVCDDDAVLPDYLTNLNLFLQKKPLPYCYSKVRFYSPDTESYVCHREHPEVSFRGSYYKVNYDHPVYPYCVLDSSQMACNTLCFKSGLVKYPYPQTRNLDASLYKDLYNIYGLCFPTGLYGQIKGAFAGQLGNSATSY